MKLNIIKIENIYGNENDNKDHNFEDVVKLFKLFKKNTNTIDLLTMFRNKLILDYAKLNQFDFVLSGKNG
mgnify:CR=1 FL=1